MGDMDPIPLRQFLQALCYGGADCRGHLAGRAARVVVGLVLPAVVIAPRGECARVGFAESVHLGSFRASEPRGCCTVINIFAHEHIYCQEENMVSCEHNDDSGKYDLPLPAVRSAVDQEG